MNKQESLQSAMQAVNPEILCAQLQALLGERVRRVSLSLDQVVIDVPAANYLSVMQQLQQAQGCRFDTLIDLCGVDYSDYGNGLWEGPRFGVVVQLLSVQLNQRVRVRCLAEDDDFPVLPSLIDIWRSANWYEREAFDLYGIVFDGHDDLRRILTDYGFIGHPFRKDFPLSGHVEMRYDEAQGRVVYQPVTIEPREITPRVIREDTYGGPH